MNKPVSAMKRTTLVMLLLTLCGFSSASSALSESEAEDLADLTAVFVYLKNDCGYNELPNNEIKRAIVYFAQQNRWDLRNYNSFNMKALGEESYRDLRGIAIPAPTKCKSLARDSLSLLAYAN
ncbi:putative chaperone lipoprotein YacC [Yersinia enterocolitica]|nr:putative chaperone lipoprotein YacC [Yersinia enterocolitica]VTP88908.1 putative chaperone lipoprotein YacC [Yersinia enterocolitica subsp. enterocolitica]CNE18430.1 putative chaperone lipoprotein YacC [Yersinia enterocolitica]CNF14791.1 putative chaperone lipoprotein YacC [Yersinia enterocolitica]CNF67425.1 putative chaperone lipoprotein YacC [Yersinia enterocolitica]